MEIYCHFCNHGSLICVIAKFGAEIIIFKFWNKNAWFAYFSAGIPKCFCHIINKRHWIWLIPKFSLKINSFKFGTKNVLFRYFWTGIWKQYCHIQNHSNLPSCKISWKNENPYIWDAKCLIWVLFGQNFKKLLL